MHELTAQTGDSLQYAFVEFDQRESAEQVRIKTLQLHAYQQAYFKMQNVLIDDRRIWVDFSQSVSKLHNVWVKQRTGGRGRIPSGSGSRAAPSGSRGPRSSGGPPAPSRMPMPPSAPGAPGLLMDFGEMDPHSAHSSERRDSERDRRSRDYQDDRRRDDRRRDDRRRDDRRRDDWRRDDYRRDDRHRDRYEDRHRHARPDDREGRYSSRRDYDSYHRHRHRRDEPYERRHRHYDDYPSDRGHREHGRSQHRDTPERRELS